MDKLDQNASKLPNIELFSLTYYMTDTFMAVVKTFLVTVIFALIYENKSESVPWTNQQEWLEHTKKRVRFLIPELPVYLLAR